MEIILQKAPERKTPEEFLFIRGLPYVAPKTAKTIAFLIDNGSMSVEDLIEKFKNFKHPYLGMDIGDTAIHFIRFYAEHKDRAKELFMDYSNADLGGYKF